MEKRWLYVNGGKCGVVWRRNVYYRRLKWEIEWMHKRGVAAFGFWCNRLTKNALTHQSSIVHRTECTHIKHSRTQKWNGKSFVQRFDERKLAMRKTTPNSGQDKPQSKMPEWFSIWMGTKRKTRANEIENYLWDLGPNINLFRLFFQLWFSLRFESNYCPFCYRYQNLFTRHLLLFLLNKFM